VPQSNSTSDMTGPAYGETRKLPDDAELLARTARGDEQAFRALVDRHARYLYGIAHSMSGNAADAEDLVQETLIAALNSTFRGESAVRTWLVGILVRRAGMLRRTKARHPTSPMEIEPPGSKPAATAGSDVRMDLTVMLEQLSPEHRQVIILRELEGLTYDEMAEAIGVPRGTIESRLHRAREELRRRFKGYLKQD
jgi:RNA polymerase sigma-70 factor, ECF subfamily